MEKTQTTYLKTVMYFGLLIGMALIVFSLAIQIAGLSTNKVAGYLSTIIFAAGIYLSIQKYRNSYMGGFLPFRQALGFGMLAGIFSAILISFFTYLAVKFEPSLIEKQLELAQEEMLKGGMSEEMVEQATNVSRKFLTPAGMFISSILTYSFFSFIISLVASAILKKERSPFDAENENAGN